VASKAYHELLRDLEAAHIRGDSETSLFLSARMEKAFENRDAAIAELVTHRGHAHKKQPERFPLGKRQSA
jgi:hypothetical protein